MDRAIFAPFWGYGPFMSPAPDAKKPPLSRGFSAWAMGDSNPRPLPCEGSALAI